MMERKVGTTTLRLQTGDITLAETDAFVHDITADCKLGSGIGGAIASRAGKMVQDELNAIGVCPTGSAVVTSAGNLKARYIIHVNGPKFHEPDTEAKLQCTVESALSLAEQNQVARLAFSPIGTGLYQVPLDVCARVMLDTLVTHLEASSQLEEVTFFAVDAREYAPFAARLEGRN